MEDSAAAGFPAKGLMHDRTYSGIEAWIMVSDDGEARWARERSELKGVAKM
jgi:hypothetical protein